jgi:hypothetical protein
VKNLFSRCLLLCLVSLYAQSSDGHTRSESYSHLHLDENRIVATVTVPLREVMILYESNEATIPPRELLHQHLQDRIHVSAAGAVCEQTSSNILRAASGFVRIELSFACSDAPPAAMQFRAMFDEAPAHVHYAKLHVNGAIAAEALLTDSADTWNFGDAAAGNSWTFLSFVGIGTDHIASGIDHIAFLLGLLLIAGSTGRAIIAVTGFTLGHSISLAAAVLGYVSANSQLVEAFIGFTVLLVAVEYFLIQHTNVTKFAIASALLAWTTGLAAFVFGFIDGRALFAYIGFGIFSACYLLASRKLQQHERTRATLLLFIATCCFGLVHGFGFAGFLMDTGLLGTSLFVPLLGFNLGVELGQLVLVTIALLGGMLLRDRIPAVMPQLVAAGLCGIGVFWFVGRTLA